jgi:hypothetical protein
MVLPKRVKVLPKKVYAKYNIGGDSKSAATHYKFSISRTNFTTMENSDTKENFFTDVRQIIFDNLDAQKVSELFQ